MPEPDDRPSTPDEAASLPPGVRMFAWAVAAAVLLLALWPMLAPSERPPPIVMPTPPSEDALPRAAGTVATEGDDASRFTWRAFADPFAAQRRRMVDEQIRGRGIDDADVLRAMAQVPRHLFVPEEAQRRSYEDEPITLGPGGHTMSQAYLSARMISLLALGREDVVLEVGTGSGYDAAVLSEIAGRVRTIEIDPARGEQARATLRRLGYDNVEVRIGNGYHGWPEEAPFDAILLTAAPARVPEQLYEQLAVGGRMVVAVGDLVQDLQVITKTAEGREVRRVSLVRLAPMTGDEAG